MWPRKGLMLPRIGWQFNSGGRTPAEDLSGVEAAAQHHGPRGDHDQRIGRAVRIILFAQAGQGGAIEAAFAQNIGDVGVQDRPGPDLNEYGCAEASRRLGDASRNCTGSRTLCHQYTASSDSPAIFGAGDAREKRDDALIAADTRPARSTDGGATIPESPNGTGRRGPAPARRPAACARIHGGKARIELAGAGDRHRSRAVDGGNFQT